MSEQLRLEGEEFTPTRSATSVMGAFIKDIYLEPMKEMMQSSQLFFGDYVDPILKLFEREPTCWASCEVGEESLTCYLGEGHYGPHYDAYARVEWLAK